MIVPTRRVVTTATHVTIAGDTLTFLDGKDKVLATYERAKSSTTPTTTTPTTTTSHA